MWKKRITKIISWETALRRVWLKLQLRGLVDLDQMFDGYVPDEVINTIAVKEFQEKANQARKNSDQTKLKQQKLEGMREAYSTLHLDEVKLLRSVYKTDFELFGYDDRHPSCLIDQKSLKIRRKCFIIFIGRNVLHLGPEL